MTRVAFSPKILESYTAFENYLESTEAIERVREEAKKPYVPGEARLGAVSVAWLTVTFPFRGYYALFLKAMGGLLCQISPLRNQGLYLWVESNLQDHYITMLFDSYLFNSKNILVDCLNDYSHDAYELYTQEPICLDDILIDWQVKKHIHKTYIDEKDRLIMNRWNGQCGGISSWVGYLYHETKYDFKDPEHHLVSIVKQVEGGASREAALMQIAQNSTVPILGMSLDFIERLKNPTEIKVKEAFESLRPGLYHLHIEKRKEDESAHGVNLAVANGSMYLIEPNKGLIKDTPENFAKRYAKNYKLKVYEISV